MGLQVVGLVGEPDRPVAVHGDAVVGIRQVLGGEPEVERVLRHLVERPAGHELRRPGVQSVLVKLADERDVTHRVAPLLRAEVVIVDREGLLEHRGVRLSGKRHHHGVGVTHVVAPHLAGAVGEPVRMAFAGRAQQQGRRVDGAARAHHDVGGIALPGASAFHVHAGNAAPARVGLEPRNEGAGEQRHVGMLERGVDTDHLGVRLGVDQAGVPVARGAADARALPAVRLVELDAERDVERPHAEPLQVVAELLDARLVAHRGEPVRAARRRLGRVHAALAVHLVEMLGARVVRLQVLVADRPRRRDPAVVAELAEVLAAEPEQRRAVELGVAAHEVVLAGLEFLAVPVAPVLRVVVAALQHDRAGLPVLPLARRVVAALEEQDLLPRRRERVGESPSAGAGADDDHVVVRVRGHGAPSGDARVLVSSYGHSSRRVTGVRKAAASRATGISSGPCAKA